jgi:hypothetical protein
MRFQMLANRKMARQIRHCDDPVRHPAAHELSNH